MKDKTLQYLRDCGIKDEEIHIFVSNVDEADKYKDHVGECNIIVPGVPIETVTEKFNFIHNYFGDGEKVFVMEDDIKELVVMNPKTKKVSKLTDLSFIERGFQFCEKAQTKLFGIIPHNNGFYMQYKVSSKLKFCVAHAYGFIAERCKETEVTQIGKSDYERTILYFLKYGSIVRFNYIGVTTASYTTEGGMDKEDRAQHEVDSCNYLVRRYPHFIRHNTKKESMYKELSFKNVKNDYTYWRGVQDMRDMELGYDTAL